MFFTASYTNIIETLSKQQNSINNIVFHTKVITEIENEKMEWFKNFFIYHLTSRNERVESVVNLSLGDYFLSSLSFHVRFIIPLILHVRIIGLFQDVVALNVPLK